MKKIILEGTPEQIKALELMMLKNQAAYPTITEEYYIDGMWSIADVQNKYKCDNDLAAEIIEEVLNGEYMSSEINASIESIAKIKGLDVRS